MSPTRSRSRSPTRDSTSASNHRSRSRSPRRKSKSKGGLRWKDKPRRDQIDDPRGTHSGSNDRGLERGYRHNHDERPPPRENLPPSRSTASENTPSSNGRSVEDKFSASAIAASSARQRRPDQADAVPEAKRDGKSNDEKKKEKKPKPPPQSNEPMIVVNINDRLGTKAAIPCLASDTIGLFKHQVAARIGRAPHEIMLKRQGERPMKDMLTLADYGVSNGVQLDLELDTGD